MNTLSDTQRDRVLRLLREGKTLRRIEHETAHPRETIAAYGRRAGLLAGGTINVATAREPVSLCEPFAAAIADGLDEGRSLRALHAELVEQYAFEGSYGALKYFVRTHLASRVRAIMLAA